MLSISNLIKLSALALSMTLLSACGGSDSSEPGKVLLTCDVPMVPDATGTSCVAPTPISCKAPKFPDPKNESCINGLDPSLPAPSVFPQANQAVLYYNRIKDKNNTASNAEYPKYKLHTWNDEKCDAYAAPFDTSDWSNGHPFDGIDPNYGAYWILNLKEGYGACGNFIVHAGTDDAGKALGKNNLTMSLVQDDATYVRVNFTIHGESDVYEYPILETGFSISGMSAHWLDRNTFVWNQDPQGVTSVKLHYSAKADIAADDNNVISGTQVILTPATLSDAQKALSPVLADWPAYTANFTADEAKAIAKDQLVLVAYDADDKPVGATYVQAAKVLDDLYTQGDQDADEATLGVVYDGANIIASVWAPTAQDVKLKVYDANKTLKSTENMTLDSLTGIWSYRGDASLNRLYYRYALNVYHPTTKKLESLESTDPYSLNVSSNGRFSQFINLDDADLKPDGWDNQTVAAIAHPEDAVIYEGHIRDFSIRDQSTSAAHRGKYLAFTEQGSAPVEHLKKLVDNGLTHFHVLPATDMATVNENASERIEMTDTLAKLCSKINDAADACKTQNKSATIENILANSLPGSSDAQALVDAMRGLDGFNWGYDPQHFFAPEGSYATVAEGTERVLELREMNQALHNIGLRVVLDVVYNHTSASGVNANAVLDKVVPGYYHRYDPVSGAMEQSTCCENTATEHRMMGKLVTDSLVLLAKEYGYDGFRFDVMGHMPKQGILDARTAVQAVDPDTYFYGEGWNFGEVADNRLFEQATQANMAGSEVGTFNDRIREAVRGGALFATESKDDYLRDQDTLRLSLAGNLQNYVLKDFNGNSAKGSSFSWNSQPSAYALDPADSINYVSKHDNETLWDILQYKHAIGLSIENRVRVQNMAASIPLLSQGVPFLQMGGDLLRSKSMDRNSYDSGDWFNYVDFTYNTNNWNVGLPLAQDNSSKWTQIAGISANPNAAASMSDIELASGVFNEFLRIRHQSPLFRLTDEQTIIDRVGFHNVGKRQQQGVIVMSLDDGVGLSDLDPTVDAIVVMINGSATEQSHTVPTAAGFSLHEVQANSVDAKIRGASFSEGANEGTFKVPAYSTAVFVKKQSGAQGLGLSANATVGAPDVVPYGSTDVFVRGGMNGWGEVDKFAYVGAGEYRIAIKLNAGDYDFKIASADWNTVDFGAISADVAQVDEGVAEALAAKGGNLHFSAGITATYVFSLDASDKDHPVLSVYNEEPFVGTPVYLRGDMNGWGTDNEVKYMGGGIYRVDLAITAGTKGFKLASSDWSTVDYGTGEADGVVVLNQEKLLAVKGGNMSITFDSDDTYSFVFDASNRNEPKLSVYKTAMFGANTVYIRGGMNGWGTVDTLAYQGASVYSVDIALIAGDNEFKIASSDWSSVDFGAVVGDEAVTLDGLKVLASKGANMHFNAPVDATYRFTVTGPDPKSPTLTVTQVN